MKIKKVFKNIFKVFSKKKIAEIMLSEDPKKEAAETLEESAKTQVSLELDELKEKLFLSLEKEKNKLLNKLESKIPNGNIKSIRSEVSRLNNVYNLVQDVIILGKTENKEQLAVKTIFEILEQFPEITNTDVVTKLESQDLLTVAFSTLQRRIKYYKIFYKVIKKQELNEEDVNNILDFMSDKEEDEYEEGVSRLNSENK